MRFSNKIAIVTGGASGIGAAICKRFSDEGAVVVATGRNAERVHDFVKSVERCEGVVFDVADYDATRSAIDDIAERHGKIDILVNGAGDIEGVPGEIARWNEQVENVVRAMGEGKPVHDPWDFLSHLSPQSWENMIAVHMGGAFHCAKSCLPHMSRGSSITNISSVGAVIGQPGLPAYSAAKAGMNGFMRSLAAELAPKGIRVNSILPAAIETALSAKLSPATLHALLSQVPMGRLGAPEEVASAVAFIASDEASFFTGQQISPNGGLWM